MIKGLVINRKGRVEDETISVPNMPCAKIKLRIRLSSLFIFSKAIHIQGYFAYVVESSLLQTRERYGGSGEQ